MRAPAIRATIQRRLLVNYRVEPAILAALLPAPFRPAIVAGCGVAGICLIRLGDVRPAGVPAALGVTSENAAHRVAVEWDTPSGPATGVYIPRRDTSSRLVGLLGGRVFPGWHHRANFQVSEGGGAYRVEVTSHDAGTEVAVAAHRSDRVMDGSVFGSVGEASAFFRCAPLGYAATPQDGVFDGVALTTQGWAIEPLQLDDLRSSFFDDPVRFPAGAAVADSAFLMAGLDTTWRALPAIPTLIGATYITDLLAGGRVSRRREPRLTDGPSPAALRRPYGRRPNTESINSLLVRCRGQWPPPSLLRVAPPVPRLGRVRPLHQCRRSGELRAAGDRRAPHRRCDTLSRLPAPASESCGPGAPVHSARPAPPTS